MKAKANDMALKSSAPPTSTLRERLIALKDSAKSFIKTAVFRGEKVGREIVEAHAENLYHLECGDGSREEIALKEAERATAVSEQNLLDAQRALDETPEYVPSVSSGEPDGQEGLRKNFSQWRVQDKILAPILSVGLVFLTAISVISVQVNIVASGSAALVGENEWKSWLMAGMASTIPLIFKMLPSLFSRPSYVEYAQKSLIGISIVSSLWWIYQFAERFQGVGAQITYGSLLDGGGSNTFVLAQLITEMFIAASLFVALNNIWDRYSPFHLLPNPSIRVVKERLERAKRQHMQSIEKQKDAHDAQARYLSLKQWFIDLMNSEFDKQLLQHHSIHD